MGLLLGPNMQEQKPVMSRDESGEGLVNRHFLVRGIILGLGKKSRYFMNMLGN